MLRPSIRNRTLLLVLCTLAIGLTLIARQSYSDARHEIEELFDAQLAQSARLLQGMLRSGTTPNWPGTPTKASWASRPTTARGA